MADPVSPKSPLKGKQMTLQVNLLDDTVQTFQVPAKAMGHILWELVVKYLELLEADYFDLEYIDEHRLQCWLDREKPILKQLRSAENQLQFCVKFYTPDPGLLEEEYTRYLFALQIKQDLRSGTMPCNENTVALLASYVVQAELGDFLEEEYVDPTYLSSCKFVPHQPPDLERKIMEYHRQHLGQSPSEADLNLLDTARKVELYGIKMFPAKDHEGVHLNLAVAHMGIVVFQNLTKINTFSWAKIRKLSFKRKKFLIKLHAENYGLLFHTQGYYKDIVEFFFDSRNECKGFWKKCIEHHAFFRCHEVKKIPRNKTRVVSRGSSYRYSGRTQKQLMEYVRENFKKRPFERTISGRISNRSRSATPKIHTKTSTLNSSDFHVSQNSTASSGSQILENAQDNHLASTRVETAEVHSESSMSGSRSLGSPKLEAAHSHDAEATTEEGMMAAGASQQGESSEHVNRVTQHSDASDSGFALIDRKMSAPVLGSNSTSDIEESFLLRSSEVENIPEIIEETSDIDRSSQRHSFSRSCSTGATPPPPPPPLLLLEQDSKNSDMSLPPPPPPPPVGDGIPLSMQTRTLLSVGDAGTLASIAGTSSNASTMQSDDGEEDTKKKKRLPAERSYYIAKELLMTERTYKKDLEVITWFRSNLTQRGLPLDYAVQLLFSYLDPIYEFHCAFLKQVEQRISMWEGKSSAQVNGDCQRIGDVILSNIEGLQLYQNYLDRQEEILTELEQTLKKNKELELTYKEFEAEKVCYLPLNTFLLKPGQRLLHYKLILDRLTKYYGKSHPDYGDCQEALTHVLDITHPFREKMRKVENLQKLIELQRDLVGIDSLVHPEREFIREGCLQKFSRKGYQQRMFFLFSDMLVYTSRTATSLLQFKVHGQLPLRGMMVEVSDMSKVAVANSFTIYGGNKCVLVAASTEEEKDKWIEDLNDGISLARRQNDDKIKYGSIKSTASSSENIAGDAMNDSAAAPPSPEKQIQHRANTTMHVCWHRNTSVSMRDHERAIKNQLSGYLLRKFKTSNGWQKLWVVFTNFCLFFYKTYQDDFPLASLPLLGYAVNVPGEDDKITKDHVFKLQFKNHVYFFRAESEYTFERWIEVINSATSSARRIRLFSRLESEPSGRS